MNKFTKDELLIFLDWLHYARASELWSKYYEEPWLIDKITSMIDNYNDCKHDGEIGINYPAEKCMQCGACLGW